MVGCFSDHADTLGWALNCCGATRLVAILATDGSLPADFEPHSAALVGRAVRDIADAIQ